MIVRVDGDAGVPGNGNPISFSPYHHPVRSIELHQSLGSRADEEPVTPIRRKIAGTKPEAAKAGQFLAPHDMVRHHICLSFQWVVDRPDFELRQKSRLGLTRSALALNGVSRLRVRVCGFQARLRRDCERRLREEAWRGRTLYREERSGCVRVRFLRSASRTHVSSPRLQNTRRAEIATWVATISQTSNGTAAQHQGVAAAR